MTIAGFKVGSRAGKNLALCAMLVFFTGLTAFGQKPKAATVQLEGQLVCSLCWFEADRNATPYGTAADIECAKECDGKGIPPALAVRNGSEFKLYVIEQGRFTNNKANWLEYLGKRVQVAGRVSHKKDKEYIALDDLKVLSAAEDSAASEAGFIGREVELALKDLFGVEQRLSAYRGKIVVLNFWATWCLPCRKEMPDLAAIQNEYAALGIQVVGTSADTLSDRSKVLQFIKETRINFPVWLGATTEDMKRFGLGPALPGTAIIGRDGKIIGLTNGVITQASLRKQIDGLLAEDVKAVKREIASATRVPFETSLVPS
jgi:thiol-disulfide isomerase/thioredoxin